MPRRKGHNKEVVPEDMLCLSKEQHKPSFLTQCFSYKTVFTKYCTYIQHSLCGISQYLCKLHRFFLRLELRNTLHCKTDLVGCFGKDIFFLVAILSSAKYLGATAAKQVEEGLKEPWFILHYGNVQSSIVQHNA